ncbi:hypothetical protein EB796_012109 [Bugula neritina]|uniref:Uncharacterized protein n=1 Tax=Bugula neritina TaxID=10212 RepID=A0A7J7JT38_BUGNE|nr:hypothetical protein EB796_012109 [Bugula neritina]
MLTMTVTSAALIGLRDEIPGERPSDIMKEFQQQNIQKLMFMDQDSPYHRYLLNAHHVTGNTVEYNLIKPPTHDCTDDGPPQASVQPGTLFSLTYGECWADCD